MSREILETKQPEDNSDELEGRRTARNYPKHTLEQALVVPLAIMEKNAGKPMKRLFLAEAIGRKPMSSEFRHLMSSSLKYGLTTGTEKADYIELTPLGTAITRPRSPEERIEGLQKAAMNPDLFKTIYLHYKDGKVPTDQFFRNVLESEFGVSREWTDDCQRILMVNGRFANLIRDISGSPYVVIGEIALSDSRTVPSASEDQSPIQQKTIERNQSGEGKPQDRQPVDNPRMIFIGHGKNREPVEQLKKILGQFNIKYKVAIDEPHQGRPIFSKVLESMEQCGSAIFIFTADEEYTDPKGGVTYKPSDNVAYELGAATVLYKRRIVILKQQGVELASDFKDLGYVSFDKNNIEARAMDIFKELVGLGFLKVTPA